MGWMSDVANNGVNAGAAQNWVNQKKEEEWAAAKEEERRKDRVNAQESVSYNPAPAIDAAKEAAKAQAEKLKETVTGGSKGTETAGSVSTPVTYEPTPAPEPEPEPTPAPAPAAAGSAAELRAEQQRPVVYSDEKAPEQVNAENGRVTARSKGEPVVYTGGTAGTIGMKRSSAQTIAAQTKNEITEEDDDATILQKYWAMSPEEQAEQVGNKRVQAALRAQANQQAAGSRGNGYLPTNPLYSEGFSTRGEYNPRATQYSFNGQQREVGVENNRPYDRPLYPAATNDQRAAEYLAGWQRRNASIQQANAMQNYQYDPLQAAILRANAGLGGSGLETRGYDPSAIRQAAANRQANDPQYLADNGFSWAGNPAMSNGERGATAPTYMSNPQYQTDVSLGLVDSSFSPAELEQMYGTGPQVTRYTPREQEVVVPNDPQMQRAVEALNRQGIYGEEAIRQAQEMVGSINNSRERIDNWLNPGNEVTADMVSMSPAEEMRHRPGYSYVPNVPATQTPETTTATPPTTGGQGTGNGRPGVDAAIEGVMNDNGDRWVPDSVRFAQERGNNTAQYLTDQAAARSGQTAGNGQGSSQGGSQALESVKGEYAKALKSKGSYPGNKGTTVSKAPFRKGGYTEAELNSMGNVTYGKKYGANQYEGYYEWEGKYYPIDQIKANYYVSHGNSYRGWDEDMREYWNNFGTFYGYRPDWRTAGGKNVWKQNRPSSRRSYGGGRGSASAQASYAGGGTNYGRGSTANNGIYWNGNTSWSI